MRSTIIAAAFAIGALASPALVKKDCNDTCMTLEQAQKVANNFQTLIAAYSDELADASLTVDFVDYSDSVSELINSACTNGPAPLGAATFTDRESFKAGQSAQPPIPFEILNLWYACTGPVVIRWRSAQTPELITGNIVLETEKGTADEPYLIKTVYSEFNSGAWLVNLGVFTPNCSADGNGPPPPPSAHTKRSVDLRRLVGHGFSRRSYPA